MKDEVKPKIQRVHANTTTTFFKQILEKKKPNLNNVICNFVNIPLFHHYFLKFPTQLTSNILFI